MLYRRPTTVIFLFKFIPKQSNFLQDRRKINCPSSHLSAYKFFQFIQAMNSFGQPFCSLRTRIECTNSRLVVFCPFFSSHTWTLTCWKIILFSCCLDTSLSVGFILSVLWWDSLQTFTSFVLASVNCRERKILLYFFCHGNSFDCWYTSCLS